MSRAHLPPVARPDYTARAGEAVRVFREDDGSFTIGCGRIGIVSDDFLFVSDVVADLGRLSHMPEGVEALSRGDRLGSSVRILKPDPPTQPPNGWILTEDLAAAGAEGRRGSTIVYDPADWPRRGDPRSPASTHILLMLLQHANRQTAGRPKAEAAG